MTLKIISIEQSNEWDTVVKSFPQYDVYWLSGYVKAFKIHGDGNPILFYCEKNNTRGINVVMQRDISDDEHFIGKLQRNKWFDFITPYGYGGWLFEGEDDIEQLLLFYERWCIENNIISEFVRFHPVLKNYEKIKVIYDIYELGETVAIALSSPEVIWENFTSKNRNMIRKAQKSGILIYNGRYPEIFEQFQVLYNATMIKNHAESYYYFKDDFYKSILYDLSSEAQIFYAVYDEKIIAASIVLAADGRLNYHLSGSIKEYQSLAPTNLLLYQAALWGYSNGYKTFHLGGGIGSKKDSLYRFKKSFYREKDLQYYVGKSIYNRNEYNALVDMRKDIAKYECTFFPQYRVSSQ